MCGVGLGLELKGVGIEDWQTITNLPCSSKIPKRTTFHQSTVSILIPSTLPNLPTSSPPNTGFCPHSLLPPSMHDLINEGIQKSEDPVKFQKLLFQGSKNLNGNQLPSWQLNMNTKSFLLLPFLLALGLGKTTAPSSLSALRSLVSSDISQRVQQKIAGDHAGTSSNFKQVEVAPEEPVLVALPTVSRIATLSNAKQISPIRATLPLRVDEKVDTVQQVKPVASVEKLSFVQPAVEKATLIRPVVLAKTADVVQPVSRLVQSVPAVQYEKAQIDVPYEKPAVKQVRELDPVYTIQPVRTIRPVETVQPVRSALAFRADTPVKASLQVEQPIILTVSKTQSLPAVATKPMFVAQPEPATVQTASFSSYSAPSSIQTKQAPPVVSAAIDYAFPLTNTIIGKNNLVNGIQNRISANNSQVVGHGNIIIENPHSLAF